MNNDPEPLKFATGEIRIFANISPERHTTGAWEWFRCKNQVKHIDIDQQCAGVV